MDAEITALVISLLSLIIAAVSMGWNIYRDVVLKPRVRVRFQVSTVFGAAINSQTFLDLTVVNHGPGRVSCNSIRVQAAPVWRKVFRRVKYGAIIGDWTNPLSGQLPRTLEVGETISLLLPYEERCFLSTKWTHVGIRDSFDRMHWAPRRHIATARQQYYRDFGKTALYREAAL